MQQSNKALVILSPGFAADEADSTCLPAQQQLVTMLDEQFPSVTLVILAFQYPFSDKAYYWKGIRVIPFNGGNKGKLHKLFLWLKVWKQLSGLRKQYQLAGLFSFWYGECALIGKWFAARNKLRHFTWLLGQDARMGNRYIKLLRPSPDELVAISDSLAKEFERNYQVRPASIIPNGIDPRILTGADRERDIDVLAAGSLIALKRYDLFIEVIKVLKQELPFIKAVICGKGPERAALEAMIAASQLQHTITLTGELPYTEVLQLMQRSKVLLHPSAYEGFSGVCLEALYAGAHVVSFCNPKEAWVRHWHIVDDLTEMMDTTLEILCSGETSYRPVMPYEMKDSAVAVMKLYDVSY